MKKGSKRPKHASRTEIVDLINNSNGRIMSITYTKVDGTERVMNCQKQKGDTSTNLGYILVNDMQEKGDKKTKSVDPRTISQLKLGGKVYKPTA